MAPFLPLGLLRDDPRRLKRATLIALQGIETEAEYSAAIAQLRPLTEAPVVAFKTQVENPDLFAKKESRSLLRPGKA